MTTLMAMMGWSNPKTAMVYVNKSRMTSLSLSLYLTNVQRRNCSNPFPKSPLEKRQAVKQTSVSSSVVAKCSNTMASSCNSLASSETSEAVLKSEVLTDSLSTQELIRDIENEDESCFSQSLEIVEPECLEESNFPVPQKAILPVPGSSTSSNKKPKIEEGTVESSGRGGSGSSVISNQLSLVDPRLSGILQNLQNTGNVTIHFHFDGNPK